MVALLVIGFLVQEVVIEGIGEQLQVRLVAEIVLRGEGGLGIAFQPIAGSQAEKEGEGRYDDRFIVLSSML
jgi:hypothetical protein